jgi:hypothetical protein
MATKKHWKRKRGVDLADDLDVLLAKLCVGRGFCTQLRGANLIRQFPILNADDFARAVLMAEGMEPDRYDEQRRWIGRIFSERYGPVASPATFTGPLMLI